MPKIQSREEMAGNTGNGENKEGHITLHYPMLSRNNYGAWAIKMRVFMQAQGVWEAVEPRTANTVVEVKKDKMALAAIYQGIPEDLLMSLAEKRTAKEAWEALKIMFMGADRVKTARIQTLKAEFEAMNMKETEGIDDFAAKVINNVSTIRTLGETVDESYVVKKLLRAVPSKFLQIASTLEQFGDLDKMTVEEVIGRLKAHEERMKGHGDNDDKKLLLTHQEWSERNKKKIEGDSKSKSNRGGFGGSQGRGRGRGRSNGGRGTRGRGGSHYQKNGGRGTSSNQDKSRVQCYNCQEFGHYAAECTNPRRERNQENNLIQDDNEPALLLSSLENKEEDAEVFLNEESVRPILRTRGEESAFGRVEVLATEEVTIKRKKSKGTESEEDDAIEGLSFWYLMLLFFFWVFFFAFYGFFVAGYYGSDTHFRVVRTRGIVTCRSLPPPTVSPYIHPPLIPHVDCFVFNIESHVRVFVRFQMFVQVKGTIMPAKRQM
ncbi:hypothetical protein L2E82_24755 [Cichorium intybus]|uniref:Uncharacterized protein n=1 Tax=Cichorium intybus TaxID=13427 RepID=A0ACB9E1D5_CICIN|nr:hypothetical protein L2E82_24755 [Cichorium intybus]